MAEPYDVKCVGLLPVWDAGKDELSPRGAPHRQASASTSRPRETVEDVAARHARLVRGQDQRQRLLARSAWCMSIGTRGKPRKLGVPGENLPKVTSLLDDPADIAGSACWSSAAATRAVEAAIALADTARA